jgi:hypothetical protein
MQKPAPDLSADAKNIGLARVISTGFSWGFHRDFLSNLFGPAGSDLAWGNLHFYRLKRWKHGACSRSIWP